MSAKISHTNKTFNLRGLHAQTILHTGRGGQRKFRCEPLGMLLEEMEEPEPVMFQLTKGVFVYERYFCRPVEPIYWPLPPYNEAVESVNSTVNMLPPDEGEEDEDEDEDEDEFPFMAEGCRWVQAHFATIADGDGRIYQHARDKATFWTASALAKK